MFRTLTVSFFAAALCSNTAEAAFTFRTVALSGDAAPGTGAGVNFDGFGSPVLNGAGQTAFVGVLTGAGVNSTNDSGIWSEGGGSGLTLVAREGAAAPGTGPGVNFGFLESPVLNGAGQTAFFGFLTGTGVNSTNAWGIWSEGGGSGLTLVARAGAAAPGTGPGVNFSLLVSPVLNGAGQTAFRSSLTGVGVNSTNDSGIWLEGGGSGLALVARTGAAAPGTGAGVDFNGFGFPVLNGAGQIAFLGGLTGAGVDGTNDSGVWSEGGGAGLALAAREGDAAPGTGPGVNFDGFGSLVLNGAGQAAFVGVLTGAGMNGTNDSGIWSEGGGSGLTLVAREGDAAPGTGPGVNFGSFNSPPVLNGAGQTAFRGFVTGAGVSSSNDSGIWSEGGGAGLKLVARAGDAAPGTGAGVNFRSLGGLVLNGAGQTAFYGELTGAGVVGANNAGIWLEEGGLGLELVAREGDLFDVNDDPLIDELRTISNVSLVTGSGGEDGRPTLLNDAGQLAFALSFTDGSGGVFVATPPPDASLPGDYNGDLVVDAADYTVWRDNLGDPTEADIQNNGDGGGVTDSDYGWWKQHFGDLAGSGASIPQSAIRNPQLAVVPEPTTAGLVMVSLAALLPRRRRAT
jgi:hypothetical protein